jgi:prepilin-type N-terminal cleavage/methylation domain-containing protein
MTTRKGFTLIEILVAMTIFSVVMTAVYAGFNTGAKVWRRGERDMEAFRDARVTLALMSKELRCAFPEAGHLFSGQEKRIGRRNADRLDFFTVGQPLEPKRERVPMILKVSYYVDSARGGRGHVLKREEQIVTGRIPSKEELRDGKVRRKQVKMERAWTCVIAEDVQSLDLEYSWGSRWLQSCKQGFGLPAVVRITLDLEDEGRRAAPRRFATAVSIPLGPGEGPPRRQRQDDNYNSRLQRRL